MRTGPTFEAAGPSQAVTHQAGAAWRSPIPYLFGGLAAMLGLIAFALLILACSYWKLSGHLDSTSETDAADSGDSNKSKEVGGGTKMMGFERSVLVIMAGDQKPTFLATPAAGAGGGGEGGEGIRCMCGKGLELSETGKSGEARDVRDGDMRSA